MADQRPTEAQLAEWAELCREATPGPWTSVEDEEHTGPLRAVHQRYGAGEEDYEPIAHNLYVEDARFVAAARTAMPALLAEVERLRGEAEEWRALAVDSSGRHGEAAGLLSRLIDALDGERSLGSRSDVADALSAARAHLGRGEAGEETKR